MPMKLTDLTLLALQTAFMQKDLTTQGFCAGLQGELRDAAMNAYRLLIYSNLDNLKDDDFGHSLADELAWQFHVDYYDKAADIETKKRLVKQSIKIHRTKGTPQAVMDLLQTAFPSDAVLLEWFDYGGEPYHFKIVTSAFDGYDLTKFLTALDSVKNARSYLDEVSVFKNIFAYATNNIKAVSSYTYEPSEIVGLAEPVMLAIGTPQSYSLLGARDGSVMAIVGRSTILDTVSVSFDLYDIDMDAMSFKTVTNNPYTVTLTAYDGYSLPSTIHVYMGGEELVEGDGYDDDPVTGVLTIHGVYADITITAEAVSGDAPRLAAPVISVSGHTLTINTVDGADEYRIYNNGVHILTVKADGTVTTV